jgi:membrane fusion protein (multidrug efflux system)
MSRYGPLLEKHAVAQQDVDIARTELEAAQSALTQAKRDFDDTFVRAEMNGRVGRTLLEVGSRVSGPGDLLTTIDRLDPVYVSFRPSSQQVLDWSRDAGARSLVKAGSRLVVEAVMPDGTVLPRTGHLDFVAPSLDGTTGTQEYRALFANPDLVLVPGQFVRARLVGFNAEGALAVPVRAVQTTLGRQFVYVVAAGDTVRARDIEPGPWSAGQWIIRHGLNIGDRVVVDGIQKVAPGRPVHPVAFVDSARTPVRSGT